jgi:hypothetical protein
MKKVSPARLPQQAFDGLKSTALRKEVQRADAYEFAT